MEVYRVMVGQVLLYGSHSWNLTAAQLEQLEVLQQHQLRRILGVRRSDRLSNKDLLQRCQQPTIEAQLRQRRGHWIGHMLRMGNGRLALQLLYSRLPGRKRQGGQFQTLISLYTADVQSALDSQQRRHVAEVAAEKNAWNDLFAAELD